MNNLLGTLDISFVELESHCFKKMQECFAQVLYAKSMPVR